MNANEQAAARNLSDMVHGFVLSRVRNPADAQDIAQETLLRIHAGLSSLKDSQKLNAWVFQIARNAIADHYRSSRSTSVFHEASVPEAAEEPVDEGLRQQLAAYIRSVIESLPALYRDALMLTEFEGCSQVEMATRLGISVTAAKSRVQRARALLKETMERCCRWETDRYGDVVDVEPRTDECDC